jgi:HAD superfamily hydrolase (TIGR01509 family)
VIKAVVFDCFGVLAVDAWLPFKERHFGDDSQKREQATALNKRANAGLIAYNDFLRGVADLANLPLQTARKEIEDNPANAPLFDYIRTKLKPRYKLGILSNASANWLGELFTPEQRALFDAVAISFELGFIKPDPRAFEVIAKQLDVLPSECVLVDDQERYGAGAHEVGMQFVLYRDFRQAVADLEKILA